MARGKLRMIFVTNQIQANISYAKVLQRFFSLFLTEVCIFAVQLCIRYVIEYFLKLGNSFGIKISTIVRFILIS